MAGRTRSKEGSTAQAGEADKLREQLALAQRELDELRKVVARVDHQIILNKLPAAAAAYHPDIAERVIALASVGFFASELRAELGISEEQWKDWGAQIPAFRVATSRARDLAKAYWHRIARRAVEARDWKLNIVQLLRMADDMAADSADDARGDASRLVSYAPATV